jgi:hypothetical protein
MIAKTYTYSLLGIDALLVEQDKPNVGSRLPQRAVLMF